MCLSISQHFALTFLLRSATVSLVFKENSFIFKTFFKKGLKGHFTLKSNTTLSIVMRFMDLHCLGLSCRVHLIIEEIPAN